MTNDTIINEQQIEGILKKQNILEAALIKEILAKALELKGLSLEDVAALMCADNQDLLSELFQTAKVIKEKIYGKRLVIFAPLYVSNQCSNNCLYCAFRTGNKNLLRRALSQEEIARETRYLIDQGHRRVLLVAGENYTQGNIEYILESIATIYATQHETGKICRINTNIASMTVENFRQLKAASIGTYQLFQETYHRATYKRMHTAGKKSDYDWHLTAMDRAMAAGIDDVGLGALLGLADWRFELLALMQHAEHLSKKFGIGPHTISVPRLEPASGSEIANSPPNPVSDLDFCKFVAILRLAVPYTGIILSTRESIAIRRKAFALGISQISAGSRTNPGGYVDDTDEFTSSQFSLGDHRSLEEVIGDIVALGYMPSFCTACYRLGRTGDTFMGLAKSGEIKDRCLPNAIITFREYLRNYATQETRELGEKLIAEELERLGEEQRSLVAKMSEQQESGVKEVYL